MSSSTIKESPLHGFSFAKVPDLLALSEDPFRGYINLRGDPTDEKFCETAEQVLGCALPLEPNRMVVYEQLLVFWLGPDEWLILTAAAAESELTNKLQTGLGDQHCAIVDVSSQYSLIEVAGLCARELLAKGCPVDLHPNEFKPGDCAQTLLAQAAVLIWFTENDATFRLLVRRSYADYLGLWINNSALEFKTVQAPQD